jgi:predicted MFS family arabinose efflux permease
VVHRSISTREWLSAQALLISDPLLSLGIGLFGLIGLFGVSVAPFTGRLVDKLVPWHATLFGIMGYMVCQAIQVGAGGVHLAAVVISCIGLDLFFTITHISLTTAVFSIEPSARARFNAVLIISIFVGQAIGDFLPQSSLDSCLTYCPFRYSSEYNSLYHIRLASGG